MNRASLEYLSEFQREFIDCVRETMKRRGIRQVALARELGVKPCYISRIFKSNAELRLSTMGAIAEAIGMRLVLRVVREKNCGDGPSMWPRGIGLNREQSGGKGNGTERIRA